MALVIIESPYKGKTYADLEGNIAYARAAVRDSLLKGESPLASHLLYTQQGILDDRIPAEREHGINAGLEWSMVSNYTVVYVDKGISSGMNYGIARALNNGLPVYFRTLLGYALDRSSLLAYGLSLENDALLRDRGGYL